MWEAEGTSDSQHLLQPIQVLRKLHSTNSTGHPKAFKLQMKGAMDYALHDI